MVKDGAWHEEKRARCIASYSSKTKMKSVEDWRVRIVKAGVPQRMIADAVNIKPPRLSEYMRLLCEPSDEMFDAIEAAIKNAE